MSGDGGDNAHNNQFGGGSRGPTGGVNGGPTGLGGADAVVAGAGLTIRQTVATLIHQVSLISLLGAAGAGFLRGTTGAAEAAMRRVEIRGAGVLRPLAQTAYLSQTLTVTFTASRLTVMETHPG